MKPVRPLIALPHRRLFLLILTIVGSLLISWTFPAPTAHAASIMRSGNDTILLIHGFNGTGSNGNSAGFDCVNGYWGTVINYLGGTHNINGQNLTWNRKDFRTLGFYRGDSNCSDYLYNYASHCTGYFDGGVGTNNEDIHHLACELSWYIYNNFGIHSGWNIEIVAHSMGGLIVRDAIYGTSVTHQVPPYPPTLGSISDVVTFATPHGGTLPGSSLICGGCTEASEMQSTSSFMNYMFNHEQSPQTNNGTDWTMIGDSGDTYSCDIAVTGPESTYMKVGHRSVFTNRCYSHGPDPSGHTSYLEDTNDANDLSILWCDNAYPTCPLPSDPGPNYPSWNTLNSAPHSLHHMMYALWLSNW